jgi:hypothetical protein
MHSITDPTAYHGVHLKRLDYILGKRSLAHPDTLKAFTTGSEQLGSKPTMLRVSKRSFNRVAADELYLR